YLAPGESDRKRSIETADDAGDLAAEAAARGARVLDPDDEQVVALLRLIGDGFGVLCPPRAHGHVDAAAGFLLRVRRQGHCAGGGVAHLFLRLVLLEANRLPRPAVRR